MVAHPVSALNQQLPGITGFNGVSGLLGSTVTNHYVQLGGTSGTYTFAEVPGLGTAGAILSNNSGSDPVFTSSIWPSTTTVNQVLYSSATNTVAGITASANGVMISNASSVPSWLANGTAGYYLRSQSSAPPAWAAPPATAITTINIQSLTSSGTYTPTSGMKYCIVEMVGGGGAGGGGSGTGNGVGIGAGGGGGEYARAMFSAATIGASKTYTIGAGGTGAAGGTGGTGGTTSFGTTLLTAIGGTGGGASATDTGVACEPTGGIGGTGGSSSSVTGAEFRCNGQTGPSSIGAPISGVSYWSAFGSGGRSALGFGARAIMNSISTGTNDRLNGSAAGANTGAGGSGAYIYNDPSHNTNGGAGGSGRIIVTEFI